MIFIRISKPALIMVATGTSKALAIVVGQSWSAMTSGILQVAKLVHLDAFIPHLPAYAMKMFATFVVPTNSPGNLAGGRGGRAELEDGVHLCVGCDPVVCRE